MLEASFMVPPWISFSFSFSFPLNITHIWRYPVASFFFFGLPFFSHDLRILSNQKNSRGVVFLKFSARADPTPENEAKLNGIICFVCTGPPGPAVDFPGDVCHDGM